MTLDTYWDVYAAILLGIPVAILCLLAVELYRDYAHRGRGRGRASWIQDAYSRPPYTTTDRRNPTR